MDGTDPDLPPSASDDGRGRGTAAPVFGVPESALRRFRATVLDPSTAARLGDEEAPRPVAYLPHRLFLPGSSRSSLEADGGPLRLLEEIGRQLDFTVEVLPSRAADAAERLGYTSGSTVTPTGSWSCGPGPAGWARRSTPGTSCRSREGSTGTTFAGGA